MEDGDLRSKELLALLLEAKDATRGSWPYY